MYADLGESKSLKSVYVDNNPYLHAMPLSIDHQEIGFSRLIYDIINLV